MQPVWDRGIWWNVRDQKDMVCIIIYVSLAISRHWSTSACDGHRCVTSEAFDISSRWSTRQSLRFTRNWMPLPLNVVRSAPSKLLPVRRTLTLPVRLPVPRSLLPLLGTTPPPSPRMPDTGRSPTPPPDRPRPIGMHPGPPRLSHPPPQGLRLPLTPSSHSICRLWARTGER